MYIEKHTVTAITATGGGATAFTPPLVGRVLGIKYLKHATVPYASTADFTITSEDTGQAILSKSNVNADLIAYPTNKATTATGAASTLTEQPVPLANERVKIVVAEGGNTKTGTFTVIVG